MSRSTFPEAIALLADADREGIFLQTYQFSNLETEVQSFSVLHAKNLVRVDITWRNKTDRGV